MAIAGKVRFIFPILILILLEISLKPKIMKYSHWWGHNNKISNIFDNINAMENEKCHKPCQKHYINIQIFYSYFL